MRFRDRQDAGRQLGKVLLKFKKEDPVVLGLPRGGMVVASEVAAMLGAPLDVCVVRKIGAPEQPEFGLGAVAEGGVVWIDRLSARWVGATDAEIDALVEQKKLEVEERVRRYRDGMTAPEISGRTVLVIDDGIATGGTMWAALQSLRGRNPKRLVVAVPVASIGTMEELRALADEVIAVEETRNLLAIGAWYQTFSQTSDDEVADLLRRGRGEGKGTVVGASAEGRDQREIFIVTDHLELPALLSVPVGATGLVIFAHGSGSSRFSPRNRQVAAELRRRGVGTLLLDLLSGDEERRDADTGELRFDLDFLSTRLVQVIDWALNHPETRGLRIGVFGASTGAAAALIVAARRPRAVHAVVSRGGRPDLASRHLSYVRAPTLLIVGGRDEVVRALNENAFEELTCEKQLQVVPGATHLFEESGALEKVAQLAGDWFIRHLVLPHPRTSEPGSVGSRASRR